MVYFYSKPVFFYILQNTFTTHTLTSSHSRLFFNPNSLLVSTYTKNTYNNQLAFSRSFVVLQSRIFPYCSPDPSTIPPPDIHSTFNSTRTIYHSLGEGLEYPQRSDPATHRSSSTVYSSMDGTAPTSRLDDSTTLHTVVATSDHHQQPSISINNFDPTLTPNGHQQQHLHPYTMLDNDNSSTTSPDVVPMVVTSNNSSSKSNGTWHESV